MASSAVSKTVALPGTGDQMPTIAYGTWTFLLAKPNEVYEGVKKAIEAGYRHIDCAWVYDNEQEVGQAIADKINDGTVKREDIFVTTKVWDNYHSRERVKLNVEKSLVKLQLTYLDLVLIHWPTSFKATFAAREEQKQVSPINSSPLSQPPTEPPSATEKILPYVCGAEDGDENFPKSEDGKIIYAFHDIVDTWKGMEDSVAAGLARNIGLSNFNSKQIQRVLVAATIKPCILQVEVNPCFTNEKLVQFAKSKNIVVSSHTSLGAPGRPWKSSTDPSAIADPVVVDIAAKKGKSPAQVILRWHLQHGLCLCVKSLTPERIRENIDVFDFELSDEEVARISGLNKNFRIYRQEISMEHPEYPFNEEF
ncbi:hypothetical protein BaRGS_00019928 [Batillaria attramentaria]|uniref:NADP-dependent oxidoreductase domain-containing protein n=1 Tax=Batillaria attramentaria TaxID=370345 RepID=A0ABD0KNY5_9CAEN